MYDEYLRKNEWLRDKITDYRKKMSAIRAKESCLDLVEKYQIGICRNKGEMRKISD